MSAPFELRQEATGNVLALFYEDDRIALNTVEPRGPIKNPAGYSYHEMHLTVSEVEQLIAALTSMKTNIQIRYQAIEGPTK